MSGHTSMSAGRETPDVAARRTDEVVETHERVDAGPADGAPESERVSGRHTQVLVAVLRPGLHAPAVRDERQRVHTEVTGSDGVDSSGKRLRVAVIPFQPSNPEILRPVVRDVIVEIDLTRVRPVRIALGARAGRVLEDEREGPIRSLLLGELEVLRAGRRGIRAAPRVQNGAQAGRSGDSRVALGILSGALPVG